MSRDLITCLLRVCSAFYCELSVGLFRQAVSSGVAGCSCLPDGPSPTPPLLRRHAIRLVRAASWQVSSWLKHYSTPSSSVIMTLSDNLFTLINTPMPEPMKSLAHPTSSTSMSRQTIPFFAQSATCSQSLCMGTLKQSCQQLTLALCSCREWIAGCTPVRQLRLRQRWGWMNSWWDCRAVPQNHLLRRLFVLAITWWETGKIIRLEKPLWSEIS